MAQIVIGSGVLDTQIHVIGEPHIIVLVKEKTLRNAISPGAEGDPVDTYLYLASIVKIIPDPAGVEEMVAVMVICAVPRIKPVFCLTDKLILFKSHIETECVQYKHATVVLGPGRPAEFRCIVTDYIVGPDGTRQWKTGPNQRPRNCLLREIITKR